MSSTWDTYSDFPQGTFVHRVHSSRKPIRTYSNVRGWTWQSHLPLGHSRLENLFLRESRNQSPEAHRVQGSTNPQIRAIRWANPSFSHHLPGPGLPSILGAQLKTVATHAAGTSLHVLACLAGIRDKKELRRRATKLSGAVLGPHAIGSLVKREKKNKKENSQSPSCRYPGSPRGFLLTAGDLSDRDFSTIG